MLRAILFALSKLSWAQRLIMRWGFAWRTASRFIAGEKLEDAIQVVQTLNSQGIQASLDPLGENTLRPEDAVQATADILQILDRIKQAGVQSNVSIKLTQVGLALGDDLCKENLVRILKRAQSYGNFIRLDMEDSSYTDRTLNLYHQMRAAGFDNVGVVIQTCLFRSENDIRSLASEIAKVRLCKGAYKEPPEIAYPKKADVDAAFDRLTECLFDEALTTYDPALLIDPIIPPIPAIATHDPIRIENAKKYAEKISLPQSAFEFQMLYGIRRDLQQNLAAQHYRVRIYVPYGTRWYPYFMRRMAERPGNLWILISNLFRR